MYTCAQLREQAQQALEQFWFIQTLEIGQVTDHTLSLRLYIQPDLFVHVFVGEISSSLYLALIEQEQRIFGIDLEGGKWHIHPYGQAHEHHPFHPDGLGPYPLLKFFAQLEQLLLDNNLV